MTTVIGIFDTDSDLEVALNRLYDKGFNDVRVVDVSQRDAVEPSVPAGAFVPALGPNNTAPSGTAPVIPAALFVPGFAGVDYEAVNGDFVTANLDVPLSDEEATFYAQALRHGGKLIIVNTDDDHADMVWSVMRNSNASQYTQAE
ncbi:MAG: hypothetical protein K8I30_12820 [Anaerolineae bacterium]|nr:hypothetical protein [Anaerolineae bacterium]